MAQGLAEAGVKVAVISLHAETSEAVAEAIKAEGGQALDIACDVLDRAALKRTRELITETFGPVDILINAASGNRPQATTSREHTLFEPDLQAVDYAS